MKSFKQLAVSFIVTCMLLEGVQTSSAAGASVCRIEDGGLPSVTVTNTLDTGAGSLRQAIVDVCDGGTISFDPALSGQTIHLASTLVVNKGITIDGTSLEERVQISGDTDNDGTGDVAVFQISTFYPVEMIHLTITKGKGAGFVGGGITNSAALSISDSIISGNRSENGGGGVFNNGGTITIDNTVFTNNYAVDGSGILNLNEGVLTITDSTFTGNEANDYGGAIDNYSSLIVSGSTLTDNKAGTYGGGIYSGPNSSATITDSTFSNNLSEGDGGAITNYSSNGLTIISSVFTGNSAGHDYGGGIYNHGNLAILNSTLSDNSATTSGGGVFNDGGTLTITNSTLSDNSALIGGGIYNVGTLYFRNSIIANSTSGGDCYNEDILGGTLEANTNSLVEDGSCSAPLNGDPNLGPLADNGGPTQTHALLAGSPAIDAGDAITCATAPVNNLDQRGVVRPQGSRCDIGAYEFKSIFADVPPTYWALSHIESLSVAGITGGCGAGNYCPDNQVTRAQMAVFLLRGIHGSSYTPPAATGTVFNDVGAGAFAAAWIEQMVSEGITSGCGGGNYCPNATVTRAQMAVFLLRAKYGFGYTPPAATGTVFTDVPLGSFGAAWIEQLVSENVTSGCGGGNYCPNAPVTRAQMAVFLVRVFNLP